MPLFITGNRGGVPSVEKVIMMLTHSHTMTPFDAPGKQAF